MNDIAKTLAAIAGEPANETAFNAWLGQQDALAFLKSNTGDDELVVYAGLNHAFIHALAVPASRVVKPDVEDLLEWSVSPDASWGLCYSPANPENARIEAPLASSGTKTFDNADKLVFSRSFDGFIGEKDYWEILQPFAHVFELHFVPERKAYCRLDKRGDLEDFVRIVTVDDGDGTIIWFRRALLDEWMLLTDSVIVQTFDFTRFRLSQFGGWHDDVEPTTTVDGDLIYRGLIQEGYASYTRGCQIVRSEMTKTELAERLAGPRRDNKQYASFTAYDFRHGVVTELSCAPGATANYFTKSDLPFELSPAFFRPEVLHKYKADSDKYRLEERDIHCRGGWYLKGYDVSEAGQVHAYLCYLRQIPYEEQLYWKAYNEPPKGPISKRAVATDFQGRWHLDYDPLRSLKSVLREMIRGKVLWWKCRSERLLTQVHYPITTSPDEWANELLQLDQLVVEGFESKWLRKKAHSLGRTPDPKYMSLKLIEECLMGLGYEEERARAITASLHSVHYLRSKLKGHASGEDATNIKRGVLAEHKSYTKHFRALAAECDEAVRAIREAFKNFK